MHRAPNASLVMTTAALALLAATAAAGAQILPPVPEKTPPSAPYEPPPAPATPAPVERPKPEPPKPLPSILKRDESGKVQPLKTTRERAALLAFEYSDEERAKVDAALAAYQQEVDQAVIDNAGKLLEIREKAANIEQLSGLDQMAALAESLRALPALDLLKTAQAQGAITAVQRRRVDNVIKEYDEAIQKELAAMYDRDQDITALVSIKGRQSFLDRTQDMRESLERQVDALAPRLSELTANLDLSADQRQQVQTILKTRIAPKAQAWKIFEDVLTDEQRTAILKAAHG